MKIIIMAAIIVVLLIPIIASSQINLVSEQAITDFIILIRSNQNASFSYVNATYFCNATVCTTAIGGGGSSGGITANITLTAEGDITYRVG